MSYVGNMPADWQQYSAALQQSGVVESERQQQQQQQVPTSSNSSSGGGGGGGGNLYNLDCLSKQQPQQQQQQQNEGYYTSAAAARMHHHHHVGGPYSMEATVGDELQQQQQRQQQQQQQVQMPMSSPSSSGTRMPPTTMTVNSAMGSVSQMIPGPIQPAPVSAAASSRQSSYACKGPCCQAGAMGYRWDKMSPFAPSNAYAAAATTSPYSSRYRPDLYAHQQQLPPPQQQQQSQQARVYRRSKESSQLPRAYQPQAPPPPPTYATMQPYNYSPADYHHHQKYYGRTMPTQAAQNPMMNSGMTAMQDKYKQTQYQNMQNGVMLASSAAAGLSPSPAAIPSPYYNHQMERGLPGEYPCKPPDPKDQVPQPMSPLQTKHMYQQKLQGLAIQRLSLEKHLREFSHMVGYQNYPKYQELAMKHREVVRMQQAIEHQSSIQSAAATAPVPSTIPPINLQFDQNGVLINSSLISSYNHSVQSTLSAMPNPMSPGAKDTSRSHPYDNKAMQAMDHVLQQQQQHHHQAPLSHQQAALAQQQPQQPPPAHQVQHAMLQPSSDQHHPHYMPQDYHLASLHQQQHHHHHHQSAHQPSPHHSSQAAQSQHTLDDEVIGVEAHQPKSKDLADKPGLDVRQFWATWAETEEEDGVNGALQNVILTEDTPIVVLEYNENLNLASANGLTAQAICVSAPAAAAVAAATTAVITNEKEVAVLSKDQISTANETNGTGAGSSSSSSSNSPVQQQQHQAPIPAATVNIIHCITSAGEVCGDEVPTIHIVDTLENEAVVKKIEGALHSLNPTDIKSIEEIVNKNNNATTATTNVSSSSSTASKQVSLEFLTASTSATMTATTTTPVEQQQQQPESPPQKNAEETNAVVASPSTNVEQTPPTNEKKDEAPEKTSSETNNLTNFVSEDTRNQDDLSLPELPTSECTTTLNTPNQSDNEESSSERARAMNNISPIISFAHSPIKFQKTGDDLHFDFQSSNEATLLKDATNTCTQSGGGADKETTHDKGTNEPKSQVLPETENAVSTLSTQAQEEEEEEEEEEEQQQETPAIEPFAFAEFSNSSTQPLLGEEPKMPMPPMEGNCLTTIINDTPPITNLRVLDSDDELADKVNDIWMDINLDNALCNSVNKLMEEKQVQTRRKSSLRHVRKHKSGVSSKTAGDDDKSNDAKTLRQVGAKSQGRAARKSLDSSTKCVGLERHSKKRARSVEMDYNSSQDQEDLLREFKSLKRKRSIGQLQDDIEMLKSSIDELKNQNASNALSLPENSSCKNDSLPILPETKIVQAPKRRFSSIFDPDIALIKSPGGTSPKSCVDSNINIKLPNVNLQIQDKKETNVGACNNSSANEGIKIEINVSRIESQRSSNDNEIVSKSNQQLNISIPPSSPVSCKFDCSTSIAACDDDITSRALPAKEIVDEKSLVAVKDQAIARETKDIDNIIAFENKNAEVEDSKCLIIENKDSGSAIKKKEIDIENAMKKLEEAKQDGFKNKTFVEAPGCSKDLDFDNFDVEPFDDTSDDYLKDLLGRKSNSNSVGYLNPLFHLDELENLNNVPVYTTKDGKITYSPNPNYTYRALIIEARQREGHALFREFYAKRNKHSSRHKYRRERETISFENCLANEQNDKSDSEERIEKVVRSTILDRTDNDKSGIRLSPVPSTPPSMVFESSRSMPLLDEETASNSKSSINRCIVDLQNLKEDILKKLNDQSPSLFNVSTIKDDAGKLPHTCAAEENFKANQEDDNTTALKEDDRQLERDEKLEKNVTHEDDSRKSEMVVDESALDVDCHAVGSGIPATEDTNASTTVEHIDETLEQVGADVSKVIESNGTEAEIVEDKTSSVDEIHDSKCEEPTENHEVSSQVCEESRDETDAAVVLENKHISLEEKEERIREPLELSSRVNDANSNEDVVVPAKSEEESQESTESEKPTEEEHTVEAPIPEPITSRKPEVKTPEHTAASETVTKVPETTSIPEVAIKAPDFTARVQTPEHAATLEAMPTLTPIAEPIMKMPELKRIVQTAERLSGVESDKQEAPEAECIPKLRAVPSKEETTRIVPLSQRKPGSPPKSPGLSLPCSIDKSSFSSELCDSFLNQEKLHASQGRIVPKLVIRKTDASPKCFSKSKSIDSSSSDEHKKEESGKSPLHPKIPKMIIRNAKSRPTTPSIEEISESSDSESKPLLMRLKRDEQSEAKIPKMKIKLEEKQPRVVIENIASEVKTVPKMKITNVKSCQPKIIDTEDDSSDSDKRSRSKRSSSAAPSQSKKAKRSPRDEVNLDPNLEDTQFPIESEYRQRNNSSSSSSSKVPKVIIKRTSPSAEFKCELSKDAIVNSQPKVVLNRSWVLDCMAKDLRHMKVVVKVSNNSKEEPNKEEKTSPNELQWRRFISGLKKHRELSRSNSTPDLHQFSPKIKRRRTSDYCLGSIDYSDSDSSTRFGFARMRSDNEAEHPTSDALDENMNSRSKLDMEEAPLRLETIMEASHSYSSEYIPSELLDGTVDVHEEEVDFESSVIKVESSDESETTIEILPASPDLSFEKDVVGEEQVYSEDAVPMQFEYEVEIGEATPDPMDVPLPSSENGTDKSSSSEGKQIPGILITEQLAIEDTSGNTSVGSEAVPVSVASDVEVVETSESSRTPTTPASELIENSLSKSSDCTAVENRSSKSSNDQVLLNDEASSTSTMMNNENANSRMTEEDESGAAGASCSSSDLLVKEVLAAKEMLKKYLGCLTTSDANETDKETTTTAVKTNSARSVSKSSDFRHSEKRKKLSRIKSRSGESHSLRTSSSSRHPSSNNRLSSKTRPTAKHKESNDVNSSRSHQIKYKSSKNSTQGGDDNLDPLTRAVEENLRHSKRREKPDETMPKRVDNVISRLDEASLKEKALQLSPEMTISSIVRELVFHEKATIRHRRYCMLCERWFPTTLRHRRHLAGYQHRHTELTQRRAIHMLFLIFTGKLCPKLLPPNVVRTDCAPGELTPLQIAVQDFATVFDGIQQVTEKQEEESKK